MSQGTSLGDTQSLGHAITPQGQVWQGLVCWAAGPEHRPSPESLSGHTAPATLPTHPHPLIPKSCGSHTTWFPGWGSHLQKVSVLGRKRRKCLLPCLQLCHYLGGIWSVCQCACLLISCSFSHFLSLRAVDLFKGVSARGSNEEPASSFLLTAGRANNSFFSSLANRGCEQRASGGLE